MRRRKSHTHRRKEGRRSKGERMAGPEINGFFGPLGTKTHQLVIHKMRNEKRGVCPHTLPPLNPPHTPSFSLPHTLPHCIFFSFFTLILQFSFFLLSPFKSTRYLAFFCLLSLSFFFLSSPYFLLSTIYLPPQSSVSVTSLFSSPFTLHQLFPSSSSPFLQTVPSSSLLNHPLLLFSLINPSISLPPSLYLSLSPSL